MLPVMKIGSLLNDKLAYYEMYYISFWQVQGLKYNT